MIKPIDFARRYFQSIQPVPAKGIVLRDEVRKLCEKNSCGNYGRNWTCPPAVESLDHFRTVLAGFDTVLIMTEVVQVKNSFDWKGMMAGALQFKEKLQALKRELEAADADFNFLILGAGACHLCDPCNYVDGKPCRHPKDAIVSLEATGIDVMRLLKESDLNYYNGKGTVTYIGGLFYNGDFEDR